MRDNIRKTRATSPIRLRFDAAPDTEYHVVKTGETHPQWINLLLARDESHSPTMRISLPIGLYRAILHGKSKTFHVRTGGDSFAITSGDNDLSSAT